MGSDIDRAIPPDSHPLRLAFTRCTVTVALTGNPVAQPIPTFTEANLERVLAREYPPEHRAHLKAVLARYGSESWQREALRVRMACLKCAGSDARQLERYIAVACNDYRDVLAHAAYPAYMKAGSDEEKAAAMRSDWAQLQEWLAQK